MVQLSSVLVPPSETVLSRDTFSPPGGPALLPSERPRPAELQTAPSAGTILDDETPLAVVTRRLNDAASITWVFAGDSITHGALYTEGWRSFPEHFAERVRWELRRFQDVVINTGVVGEGSGGLLANLDARVLRFRCDVALVMIGMNNAISGVAGRSSFRDDLYEIVGRIREAETIPILQTPNTVFEPNARRWCDLPAYVEIIREVARETASALVDHWKYWEEAKSGPAQILDWLQDQSIHPNVYGHRAMARHLCASLGIFDPASLTCRLAVP
jgi:acyl-CoA thioesterase I